MANKIKASRAVMNEKKITEKLNEILPDISFDIKMQRGGFDVEFRYHDTSFSDLQALSMSFGTQDINFSAETREGGYCETCRYSYSVNIVSVRNISPEWEIENE